MTRKQQLMKKVNFLTFFWGDKYSDLHIDVLHNALTAYCDFKFEFHVLTDRSLDVNPEIRQWELWHDHEMEGRCWRRLRAFEYETMQFIPHYFALDIDILLTPRFNQLVRRVYSNELTLCRSENPKYPHNPYSGTMWQVGSLKAADEFVWQPFCRMKQTAKYIPLYRMANYLRRCGYNGSDSAVLGYCLQNNSFPSIGAADGIYSYPNHIQASKLTELPPNTTAVLFHGCTNDFLRVDVAVKYEFVNDYLKKFCTFPGKEVTIEAVAGKYFSEQEINAEFLDHLRGFGREILQ